jgi:hypothetical protein
MGQPQLAIPDGGTGKHVLAGHPGLFAFVETVLKEPTSTVYWREGS